MAQITENYDAHTKDELLAEASDRGITTVTTSSLKADIVAALEDNDETNEAGQNAATQASGIPKVAKKPENIPASEKFVPDDSAYRGSYVRTADGEPYALAIIEEGGEYGRTHFAKNSDHFWSGTREEFKAQFDKK